MNIRTEVNSAAADDIRRAAMDYAEGWCTADADRMARAVHPNLVKRSLMRRQGGDGWTTGPISTAEKMIAWTTEGGGSDWSGEFHYEIEILDIFRDIASVRCHSPEYIDYLQLARFGDEGWKIVNVLWQLHEGEYVPD